DTEGAGDAFAAAKAEPDRKYVSENGGESGGNCEIVVARRDVLGDLDSEKSFAAIEKKRGDAEALGSGAEDIRRADVAAAGGADVLMPEYLDEDIAERDRTQQIGERNGEEPGVHVLCDEFSKGER